MNVQTYLYFNGECDEAIRLYERGVGMKVEFLQRYSEGSPPNTPEGWADKIFHATAKLGDAKINLSDCIPCEAQAFSGFALLAHMDSEPEADHAFEVLREGGEVKMELQATPWAPCYGIVRDRFGITWKIMA